MRVTAQRCAALEDRCECLVKGVCEMSKCVAGEVSAVHEGLSRKRPFPVLAIACVDLLVSCTALALRTGWKGTLNILGDIRVPFKHS